MDIYNGSFDALAIMNGIPLYRKGFLSPWRAIPSAVRQWENIYGCFEATVYIFETDTVCYLMLAYNVYKKWEKTSAYHISFRVLQEREDWQLHGVLNLKLDEKKKTKCCSRWQDESRQHLFEKLIFSRILKKYVFQGLRRHVNGRIVPWNMYFSEFRRVYSGRSSRDEYFVKFWWLVPGNRNFPRNQVRRQSVFDERSFPEWRKWGLFGAGICSGIMNFLTLFMNDT